MGYLRRMGGWLKRKVCASGEVCGCVCGWLRSSGSGAPAGLWAEARRRRQPGPCCMPRPLLLLQDPH